MVDIQNATLSGGVAVGAIADLMLQPYGAFFAGSIVGAISTLGFRKLQVCYTNKLSMINSASPTVQPAVIFAIFFKVWTN